VIPDYCEAITAYRAWYVLPNGLLVGQAHQQPWPPYQAFVAHCWGGTVHHLRDGRWNGPPLRECDCGIYAVRTYGAALERVAADQASMYIGISASPPRRVWGTVKIWGRIIEHELGYRAEFAYPAELWCEDLELAGILAPLYGVPCGVRVLPPAPRQEFVLSNGGIVTIGGFVANNNQIHNNIIYGPASAFAVTIGEDSDDPDQNDVKLQPWWQFWK